MVLPKSVARANRIGLNRVTRLFAGWMPGFAIVIHRGRRSGKEFRTPLNVFRRPDGYVVALTYGPNVDWVRNVRAANGCEFIVRRKQVRLTDPRLVHDETRSAMPPIVRQFLGLVGVTDFLYLTYAPE